MRRVEHPRDFEDGRVTYEFVDGNSLRCVTFNARDVAQYGITELVKHAGLGHLLPTERVPVFQQGRRVGTVPPDFDPAFIKSSSYFYEPRQGDFRRETSGWIASSTLCPGDFEAIAGFVWDRGSRG